VDPADEPWALDNERPAHVLDLPAFRLDRVPVNNTQWQAFIADGGYAEPRWWSTRGWTYRVEAGLDRPKFWAPDGTRQRFGVTEEIPPTSRCSTFASSSRGIRGVGRRTIADRGGMGEGVRVDRPPSAAGAGPGAPLIRPRSWRIWR